jgi:hypothetical protein
MFVLRRYPRTAGWVLLCAAVECVIVLGQIRHWWTP